MPGYGTGIQWVGPNPALTAPAADNPTVPSGFGTMPRWAVTSTATMSNQVLRGTGFIAPRSMTVGSMRVYVAATAAGATPTLIRMGLYTIAANGIDATLAASTANDTTLLGTINTGYTKALSASLAITQGTRYFATLLVVTGATAPAVCAVSLGGTQVGAETPRFSFSKAGQADLPANLTSYTDSLTLPYFELIPA